MSSARNSGVSSHQQPLCKCGRPARHNNNNNDAAGGGNKQSRPSSRSALLPDVAEYEDDEVKAFAGVGVGGNDVGGRGGEISRHLAAHPAPGTAADDDHRNDAAAAGSPTSFVRRTVSVSAGSSSSGSGGGSGGDPSAPRRRLHSVPSPKASAKRTPATAAVAGPVVVWVPPSERVRSLVPYHGNGVGAAMVNIARRNPGVVSTS